MQGCRSWVGATFTTLGIILVVLGLLIIHLVLELEEWEAFVLTSHLSFLLLLLLSLLLLLCGSWPRLHHRSVSVSRRRLAAVERIVAKYKKDLDTHSKEVITSRIEDGFFDYSDSTEEAEKKLLSKTSDLMAEVEGECGKSEDSRTLTIRCLKTALMTNDHDIRGSRRLSVICSFIQQVKQETYKPGWWSRFKRSCLGKLCCCLKPSVVTTGIQIGYFVILTKMVQPIAFIILDMSTDASALVSMYAYTFHYNTSSNESAPTNDTSLPGGSVTNSTDSSSNEADLKSIRGVFIISCFIFTFSLLSLLTPPGPLPCLLANVRTSVMMDSTEMEEEDVPVPMDHTLRYEVSINESRGESAYQAFFFLILYLRLVSVAVLNSGPEAETDIKFSSSLVLLSVIVSLLSLALGQMKAHDTPTEYSSSFAQKVLMFIACLASTVSTQLMLIGLGLALADIPGAAGGLTLTLTLLLLPLLVWTCRRRLLRRLLPTQHLLTTRPDTSGNIVTRVFKLVLFKLFFQAYSQFIEVFQLQSSKVEIDLPDGRALKKLFLPPSAHLVFLGENIVGHITLVSLSLAIHLRVPSSPSISLTSSPALYNFLLTFSIGTPLLWTLSQGLLIIYYYIDNGAETCGLEFHFINKKARNENNVTRNETSLEENNEEEIIDCEGTSKGSQTNHYPSEAREAILAKLFNSKLEFVSESGRWVHPELEGECRRPGRFTLLLQKFALLLVLLLLLLIFLPKAFDLVFHK